MNNTPLKKCRSLLPPNRTAREKVLELVACTRLDAIPLPIKSLMNADECPAELLNFLADSMSVDYWDGEWPEDVKRDMIKASLSVHWHKGTDGAVEDALKALGVTADVTHWWQESPKGTPGTMKLIATANKNLDKNSETFLGPKLAQQIRTIIKHVKRGCIHMDIVTGANFDNEIQVANALSSTKLSLGHMVAVI